ncbi:MAG: hypothetical protein ACX94A_13795 [Algiphilus sp.]
MSEHSNLQRSRLLAGLAAPLLFALSATVLAQDGNDDQPEIQDGGGGIFSTFGVQRAESDFDNLGEAINIGGSFGVQFGRIPGIGIKGLGIGLSLVQTIRPGDNEGPPPGALTGGDGGLPIVGGGGNGDGGNAGKFTRSDEDFIMQSLGAFLSYRTPTTLYGIAKAGYAYTDTNIPELDDDREGFAWQVGAGYRYGSSPIGVELLYARYTGDVDAFVLEIGTDFNFQ